MAVYRNLQVDIPKERVTIEKQKNGKPALIKYVIEAPYNREKGYPEPKRTTIGHQCPNSRTKMYPTSQYKKIFPKKWEDLTKEKAASAVKDRSVYPRPGCKFKNRDQGYSGPDLWPCSCVHTDGICPLYHPVSFECSLCFCTENGQ